MSNGKESKPLRELRAQGPSPANEEKPFQELGAYGPSSGDEKKKSLDPKQKKIKNIKNYKTNSVARK